MLASSLTGIFEQKYLSSDKSAKLYYKKCTEAHTYYKNSPSQYEDLCTVLETAACNINNT